MKADGSQTNISTIIAGYIQTYINTYGIKSILDPFCGYPFVVSKVKCQYKSASDINPYLVSLLRHVQQGYELPLPFDNSVYSDIQTAFYKAIEDGHYMKYIDGYDSWFIGCAVMLNSRHKDLGRYNANRDYEVNVTQLKKFAPSLQKVRIHCCDYMKWDWHLKNQAKRTVIYCDYPDEKRIVPWDVWFMKEEFFEWAMKQSNKHIVFISGKEAPDDFVEIYSHDVKVVGYVGEKLFVHKRWALEWIL